MRKTLAAFLALLLLLPGSMATAQQGPSLTLVRDAEIETSIRTMLAPIFAAAGLNAGSVKIRLVQDNDLNAFVADGQSIFINTGLILRARNAGELIGVLAHEVGHIAGGHVIRGAEVADRATTTAIIGTLLGAAALAASGGAAGPAVLFGGPGLAGQSMMAYTRANESAADQAGVRYMQQAGVPPDGALTLLEYFADQELGGGTPPAYALTHPLASDRLEALRRAVESSPLHGRPMPAGYDAMFARMQAKLYGFLWPQQVVGRYPADDTSLNAEYARAIAAYRQGILGEAITRLNTLLAAAPNDPYFQELAGQMLLESGRLADARPHYERALSLKPGEPLFLIPLAQTKIDAGDLTGAIRDLEHAALDETAPSLTYRLLATAYGMQGDIGIAASYLAVEALRRGDKRGATEQATRAMQLVARGTPAWFRAEDIIDSLRAAGG